MTEPTDAPLVIDVVSDVMCPWCYIGKKRLEKAVSALNGEIQVEIRWRPYQLDPTLPKEGKDRKQYLEDKFGGPEGAEKAYATVRQAGAEDDIPFDFGAIEKSSNTLDAHRVIRWAGSQGQYIQGAVVDLLFKAYFEEGKNLGDDGVLIDAARAGGLDPHIVRMLLKDGTDREKVEAEIASARQMGVTGVPCFVLGEKYALLGAQPADLLEQAIRQVAKEKAGETA